MMTVSELKLIYTGYARPFQTFTCKLRKIFWTKLYKIMCKKMRKIVKNFRKN